MSRKKYSIITCSSRMVHAECGRHWHWAAEATCDAIMRSLACVLSCSLLAVRLLRVRSRPRTQLDPAPTRYKFPTSLSPQSIPT